jgi:hypothetical protein
MLTVSAGMCSRHPATGRVTPFLRIRCPSNGRRFITVTQQQAYTLQYVSPFITITSDVFRK